jgi:enoyl-CoA hydratase
MESCIQVEQSGRVATVTLNRPTVLNAISVAMLGELEALSGRLAADESVGAVVIRGAGERAFCAGDDISEFQQTQRTPEASREHCLLGHRVFQSWADLPVPVVAAIEGYCLGGGLELALVCDLRVAAEDAVFGFPEIRLGLFPAWGGLHRLPLLVGEPRARQMILTGENISCAEACRDGLVQKAVSHGSACEAAGALAAVMAGYDREVVAYCKEALSRTARSVTPYAFKYEALLVSARSASPAFRSQLAAFLARKNRKG